MWVAREHIQQSSHVNVHRQKSHIEFFLKLETHIVIAFHISLLLLKNPAICSILENASDTGLLTKDGPSETTVQN